MKFFCLVYLKCYITAILLILIIDGYSIVPEESVINRCPFVKEFGINRDIFKKGNKQLLLNPEITNNKNVIQSDDILKPVILGISEDTGWETGDGITKVQKFFLYGNAEPGSLILVLDNDLQIGQTNTDETGSWKFETLEAIYDEGIHSFIVSSTDTEGNNMSVSDPFPVIIDITVPEFPMINSMEDDTGISSTDALTNDKNITISGKGEPGSIVTIMQADSGKLKDVPVDLNGFWIFTYEKDLASGNYSFSAYSTDAAGNTSLYGNSFNIIIDVISPVITFSSEVLFPTNYATIPLTINFNKAVFGFDESDLLITGADIGNFSGSDKEYILDLVNSANGEVSVVIPAGCLTDSAGNTNSEQNFKFIFDNIQPEPQITSLYDFETNNNPLSFKINFSEAITGLQKEDIIVENGAASEIEINENVVLLKVIPDQEGEVNIKIPEGITHDLAGNANIGSEEYTIIYDSIRPEFIISNSANLHTNNSLIPITIEFNENVSGLSEESFIFTGASMENFNGTGRNYSFSLIPSEEGIITVILQSNACNDLAGNYNNSDTIKIVYDVTAPDLIIASDEGTHTGNHYIPVNVSFNEDVLLFSDDDITVTGGSIVEFSGNGKEYMLKIIPDMDGEIVLKVNAGKLTDLAGNANNASNEFSIIYDGIQPSVSFLSEVSTPSSEITVPVKLLLSEAIMEIAKENLRISGGEIENFQGSDLEYTFNITNYISDTILVYMPSGMIKDLAGNLNIASDTFIYIYINPFLNVKITSPLDSVTNKNIIPVQFDFNKETLGFDSSDIEISGGVISNFRGEGKNFSAEIIPEREGIISVLIPEASAQTDQGLLNLISNEFIIFFDTTAPSITISSDEVSPTNNSLIKIKLNLSENIKEIDSGSVIISGAELINIEGEGKEYYLNIIPVTDGTITIQIPKDVFMDLAGNINITPSDFSIFYDSKEPVLLLSTEVKSPTRLNVIPVKIQFSEDIFDFTSTDIFVSGGSIDNFTGSGNNYTFNVLPVTNGEVKISIPNDIAKDKAGNLNSASNSITVVYDAISPIATITSPYPNPTYRKVIPINVNFSEEISDFSLEDIEVSGGLIDKFTGSGKLYTFEVSASEDGLIEIHFPASVANDFAGNLNMEPDPFVIRYYTCDPAFIIKDLTDFDVCSGDSKTLDIEAGGADLEYNWQIDIGDDEGFKDIEDNQVFIGSKTPALKINNIIPSMNNYMFQCLITGNCKPSAVTNSIVMKVNPVPEVTFSLMEYNDICYDSLGVKLSGGLPKGGNYSGQGVTGENFYPYLSGVGEHKIVYHFTDSNGCNSYADELVKVSTCLGIENPQESNMISLFPNPFSNTININSLIDKNIEIEVRDFAGTIVRSTLLSGYLEMDATNLAAGIYLIRFMISETIIKEEKIIKY